MAPKGDLAVNQRLELGQEAEEAVEKKSLQQFRCSCSIGGFPGPPPPVLSAFHFPPRMLPSASSTW